MYATLLRFYLTRIIEITRMSQTGMSQKYSIVQIFVEKSATNS